VGNPQSVQNYPGDEVDAPQFIGDVVHVGRRVVFPTYLSEMRFLMIFRCSEIHRPNADENEESFRDLGYHFIVH
jgi:hypothetical protein